MDLTKIPLFDSWSSLVAMITAISVAYKLVRHLNRMEFKVDQMWAWMTDDSDEVVIPRRRRAR